MTTKPAKLPVPSHPIYSNSQVFPSANTCKIGTSLTGSGESLSFTRPQGIVPVTGTHKALVLMADFSNVAFSPVQLSQWTEVQVPMFKRIISSDSYDKLNYQVDVNPTVFHIPLSSLSYHLEDPSTAQQSDMVAVIHDAVAQADLTIDFSQYEFFSVVFPDTTTVGNSGAVGLGPSFVVDGRHFNRAIFGSIHEYQSDTRKSIWFTHEFGHLMGLLHAFPQDVTLPIWGVMSNGVSSEPDFLGWERYISQWIPDSQVRCIDGRQPGTYFIGLNPLEEAGSSLKLTFVRLQGNRVLVIEYRTAKGNGHIQASQAGPIVYLVDADQAENSFAMVLGYNSNNFEPRNIGTLHRNEGVEIGGITVTDLGNFSTVADVKVKVG